MTNPQRALTAQDIPIQLPFHLGPVSIGSPTPPLGPLSAFTGTYITRPDTNGFNTIFRPNSGSPIDQTLSPNQLADQVLELNLTSETLKFSTPVGNVPNRGEVQPDIFLNGVPYLQTVNDVTRFAISRIPQDITGIHLEPGLWMVVPPTTVPAAGPTVVRMGSIPHGTTICAQGTAQTIAGPPDIFSTTINPDVSPGGAFPSQTATATGTSRIPQDLGPYLATGVISQAMLDDPNTVLRNAIRDQSITSTTVLSVSTTPGGTLIGGGVDNIGFLLGDISSTIEGSPLLSRSNARVTCMAATFWIETVEHVVRVPLFTPGQPPLQLSPEGVDPAAAPTYLVDPPFAITEPRTVTATSVQIQYSQFVMLSFDTILWPHVSVATLIPADPVVVPLSPVVNAREQPM